jgi:ankyrin repeat domain-containing protein 17
MAVRSKRLLVKASVISRVIGRGGCNINAIRDISTAQVEIDRSRDATTERIITIKFVIVVFISS